MKQFFIFVVFLTATSLANANLVQESIASNAASVFDYKALIHGAEKQLPQEKSSKIGFLYAKLFDYTARFNQKTDQEGLSTFWKNTQISNAIDRVNAHKYWHAPDLLTDNAHDILQIAANSLNDNYATDADNARLNEVPLPAAAWLFASAIVLFGFARRNNI